VAIKACSETKEYKGEIIFCCFSPEDLEVYQELLAED
jgi:hypothetical protein